jgi:hypothetical protein
MAANSWKDCYAITQTMTSRQYTRSYRVRTRPRDIRGEAITSLNVTDQTGEVYGPMTGERDT